MRLNSSSGRDRLNAHGLERLNEAEREVLRLLARGHTAKSAAVATGWSVGAVNERLREARRKTGVGSSRELARMLRAQENRDEEMGVAAGAGFSAAGGGPADRRGWLRKGYVAMALFTVGLAVGAVLLVQEVGSPERELPAPQALAAQGIDDPLVDDSLGPTEEEPRQVAIRLRAEPRDEIWAPRAEAAIRERYGAIPSVGEAVPLRVLCGATLCEVVGSFGEGREAGPAMKALQSPELREEIGTEGLEIMGQGFRSGAAEEPNMFYAYLARMDGREEREGVTGAVSAP